ncbi:hypothetical protein CALK_1140 [Chitinivibrio alkaliphilus ACht1]|uniref:Uncharacterized protein n=1 Tax=Chitinivibrio alkaliphilus ACht1 TaxID=1313304 RepID=U7DA01_9BACT|nr:hypothetical protein CALK_1140 [Chitinivibrio alkaliphilus ACht1]
MRFMQMLLIKKGGVLLPPGD